MLNIFYVTDTWQQFLNYMCKRGKYVVTVMHERQRDFCHLCSHCNCGLHSGPALRRRYQFVISNTVRQFAWSTSMVLKD